jgi:alkaline phosphatase
MRIFTLIILLVANAASAQYIHSHNDYKQAEPFTEAYANNAYSIEADIFLQNGKLYVAHEVGEIDQSKTLEKLYLEPLKAIDYFSRIQLLIDIKTDAKETLNVLLEELKKHPKLIANNQIRFVISGNRPAPNEYHLYPDYVSFDHQSLDDIAEADFKKIALFSFPFYKYSLWKGGDFIDEKDAQKLLKVIQFVHDLGYEIRFWGTPDTPIAWRTFQQLRVDYINTDKPKACNTFLNMYK